MCFNWSAILSVLMAGSSHNYSVDFYSKYYLELKEEKVSNDNKLKLLNCKDLFKMP